MMNFIPYGKQSIDEDDINSVVEVLKLDSFVKTGPKIKEFEDELCKYTNAKYCVAVANGTAALHLASLVLLNKGDKVITTPNSFIFGPVVKKSDFKTSTTLFISSSSILCLP